MPERKYCNKCGKELGFFDLQNSLRIHTTVGYGSAHDGDTVDLRLCNDCFDAEVASCMIDPVIEEGAG